MNLTDWIIEFAGPDALVGGLPEGPEAAVHLLRHYQDEDESRRVRLRQLGLERIAQTTADESFLNQVRQALGFDVEMMSGSSLSSTIEGTGDYRKAFDVVDDAGKFKSITTEQLDSISQGAPRLFGLKDYMLKATWEWTTELDPAQKPVRVSKRLFSDKDIRTELFSPLVREGVIGDTWLLDRYSDVAEMLDESNKLYLGDLAKYSEKPSTFGAEAIDLGVKVLSQSISAVVAGVAPTGTEAYATGALVDTIGQLTSAGVTGIKEIYVGFKTQEIAGGMDRGMTQFATVIGKSLALGLEQQGEMSSSDAGNWGGMVTAGIKGGAGLARMGKTAESIVRKYQETKTFDAASFIDGLGLVIEQSFVVASKATGNDGDSEAFANAARWIGKSFRTAAKTAEFVDTLQAKVRLKDGKLTPDDWFEIFSKAAETATKAISEFAIVPLEDHRTAEEDRFKLLKKRLDGDESPPLDDAELQELLGELSATEDQRQANASVSPLGISELNDTDAAKAAIGMKLSSLTSLSTAQGSAGGTMGQSFGQLFGQIASNTAQEGANSRIQKQLAELETQRLREQYGMEPTLSNEQKATKAKEELDDERETTRETLELLAAGGDPGYDALAALVGKYKTRKAVWNTLVSVGSAGMAVAQQFCSAMAIGGTALNFAKEAALVLEHATAIHKWKGARGWSRDSASAYLSSIEAEVHEAAAQITHHVLQAALLVVRLVGQIISVAGAAAQGIGLVIGTIIDKSAQAAATMEELIYRIVRKQQVKSAWNKTVQALENPSNRRLGLQARAMNPTLAKYSLAYGAYVAKDPIARMTLAKFGIDDVALETAEAGLEQVRKAMESLFSEDNVVMGKPPYRVGWSEGIPIKLSTVCWFQLWSKATRVGNLRKEPAPDDIRDAFQGLRVQARRLRADGGNGEIQAEYEGALAILQRALSSWTPRMETDPRKVNEEMHAVLHAFLDQISIARGMVPTVIDGA